MSRSTVRYEPKFGEFTRRLLVRILELVAKHPRYGYKRIWKLLRRGGWKINHKRVHRLWKRESLRVPKKARKRLRGTTGESACDRRKATHRNDVWTLDFAWDVTEQGSRLKFLPIVDEFTREFFAIQVGMSI